MTPYATRIECDAYTENLKAKAESLTFLAYQTELFQRQKMLKPWADVRVDFGYAKPRIETAEEMLLKARQITANA